MGTVRETAIFFFYQAIAMIFSIATDVVISRSLGAAGRGSYYLLLTTSILTVGVGILGMGNASAFMLAKRKASPAEVHSVVVPYTLSVSAITGLFFWLLGCYSHNSLVAQLKPFWGFGIVLILIELYRQCLVGMMIGINKVLPMGRFIVVLSALNFVLVFIALRFLKMGIRGALTLMLLNGAMNIFLMIREINKNYKLVIKIKLDLISAMLKYGGVAHVGNSACQIYQRLGVYFLNWYQGIAAVGIYTLATTIAEKQLIVLGAVNVATNYRIIGEERQNSEILMARILRTSILILLIICCIALTFGRWVIGLLYGPQFASTTHLLVILLPGTLSLGLASLISNYFSGQLGRPSITTGLSIAVLVVSVPCYHFLIHYLGANGAALAISLIYLLHFTSLLILFVKMSGVPFKQAIFSNIHDLKFIYEGIKHRTVSPKMPLPNEAIL